MKTKSAFSGVVVLTGALIVVKVLSALYRVPYQNVLGDEGLYAYQQIYPIVALGMILSMNAIPSAVTQTLGGHGTAQRYSMVLRYLQIVAIFITALLFLLAHPMAWMMGDVHLETMIRAASLSFLFVGVLGVLRGHYQSQQLMTIPAISQVIEQIIRVTVIFVAMGLFILYGRTIYQAGMLAILGSSVGFLGSSLYLIYHRPFKYMRQLDTTTIPWRRLMLAVMVFAISQLLVILWQFIDSFTVVHMLKSNHLSFHEAIKQKGIYDRGASFIQMGLIVTTTFSFVLIPLLTCALQEQQWNLMNRYANASLKITILISSAAAVGLVNLLPLMNQVFFKTNSLVITLSVYMITVILVSLIMMYIALLQVFNEVATVMISVGIGLIVKGLLNIMLIYQLGILGASVSTVLSLSVTGLICHQRVTTRYKMQGMGRFFIKLLASMLVMSLVVQAVMWLIPTTGRIGGLLELLIAAFAGVGIFTWLIAEWRMLSYRELKHLPYGDKLYHFKTRSRR